MNILFICEVDWIDKVVFEMHNLAETLSIRGHDVYAIDYRNDPTPWEDMEFVSRVHKKSAVLLRRPRTIPIKGLARIWAWYTHYHVIKDTIERFHIDAIILYSVPTNGLQTVFLAKKFNIPVLFRSIDKLHAITKTKMVQPIIKRLEKMVYKKVSRILTITPMLSGYTLRLGATLDKVKILPLMVDDIFRPLGKKSDTFREAIGWPMDSKIILFMGTLHEFSGIQYILEDMPKLLEQVPEARLLIVGDGPFGPSLKELIENSAIGEYVILMGAKPYNEMPHFINASDICICPFIKNNITSNIFPSKIIQYMACAKPVLTTNIPGVKNMLPEGVVKYSKTIGGLPYSIAYDLIYALQHPIEMEEMGKKARQYVLDNNSQDAVATQLEEHIKEAILDKRA